MLDESMTDWTPPAVQADTGRKIRTDARVAASFVMTLPEEIDPKNGPKVDAWIDTTMDWWNSLPGKPAYAVVHMDEPKARPHIHALRIPVNEAGNLNYKRDFGGHRERLDEMQESYALALEPLGVFMAHEEDRKKRRAARKEPDEPAPTPQAGRRQPKTRPPETPRAELEAENNRLRQMLKDSRIATQKDYQGLKLIKDSDLPEGEKYAKMGEHVVTAIERAEQKAVEETPAEEDSAAARPVSSPATPKQDIATPDPAPGPSFADVIRDWMQHEAAKRQEAEIRADKAEREEKAQKERADAAETRATSAETTLGTAAAREEEIIQMADTEYNKLDAEHVEKYNALVKTHNNLLERCRPWLNLVKQFVKDGLLNAQKVLKAGMVEYGIWDKLGPRVMDDPDPQPEPEQKPEQDPGGPVLG